MTRLVDTSAWIHALRRDGDSKVRTVVGNLLESGDAAVCDLIAVELLNGARGKRERAALEELLESVRILSIDAEVWNRARALAAACREDGTTVPTTDIVIFACGSRWNTGVVHADRHFEMLQKVVLK